MRVIKKIIYIITFPIRLLLIGLIYFYKYCISPILPKMCRFTPTCSTYALQALREYGIIKGTYLSIHRIFRCNHFNHGENFDPVKDNIYKKIRWIV